MPRPRRDQQKFAAVVLAAGMSKRFGSGNKLLAPHEGKALLTHIIKSTFKAGLDPVIVVTGHQHTEVETALAGFDITCCHNDAYRDGMGTSIACGVTRLPDNIEGFFLCLGDMPQLSPSVFHQLRHLYEDREGEFIIRPAHKGQPGHPVLFPPRFKTDLMTLTGDSGAKEVLAANTDRVVHLDYPDPGVIMDIDTPKDLQ